MSHAYTEDQLVEQPAIGLFAELGWTIAFGNPHPGPSPRRRRSSSAPSPAGRGKQGEGRGGQQTVRVRVIDWENSAANDFLLVSQFSVTGALYTCRSDLIGFVNGLPLVVIELKKPGVPARAAFDENLTHYKQQIPALFWYNALLIASNGTDSRVGSLTADWERFFEWKRIEREDEPRRVALEVMLRGTCDRARLLDLVENFTLFSEHKAGLVKIIGQNRQFLGVNNSIASMLVARKLGHVRVGVFWQTQGSGKSFSMVFFAQKVLRKVAGNWTFVVVTDRVELERVEREIAKLVKNPDGKTPRVIGPADAIRLQELNQRLEVLKTTDMALIVSPVQNEIEQMKRHGLDIEPHRKRMNDEALDEKFKDSSDPLRIVFLCAMWLTGFDAPSCSTVYLDKPMRNHTLMQTIARANRVFPGKHSGMIVDYANVFASLEKALAIYGPGGGGGGPVKDKAKLVEELRNAVAAATAFCAAREVNLTAGGMERLQRIDDAVNALISPDPLRREFFGHERLVATLYNAVKPDPSAVEFSGRVACIIAIAAAIRTKLNPDRPDITEVMGDIAKLLDASIKGVGMPAKPAPVMDLSKIDFEALRSRFKESKHKNTELEVLKAAIRAQLEKLIRLNKTRADFAEKFEELIESYNTGSRNIGELFEELVKLSRNLSEEQQRHIRENMSEEELVIFDILTRPAPELSTEERAEVKKVARELLARLKQLLVLNWRQKSAARSQLKLAIEDVLDTGLPRAYDKTLYQQKCAVLFEHVYESYPERDANVYAEAG